MICFSAALYELQKPGNLAGLCYHLLFSSAPAVREAEIPAIQQNGGI
jgi:hypothetical protein